MLQFITIFYIFSLSLALMSAQTESDASDGRIIGRISSLFWYLVGYPLSDLRYPAGYSFIRPDILPFLVAGFRSNIRHCEDFRHPAAGNPAWAGPISNWTPASSKGRIFANTGYLNRPYTRNWLNWLFCTILSSRKIWIF